MRLADRWECAAALLLSSSLLAPTVGMICARQTLKSVARARGPCVGGVK